MRKPELEEAIAELGLNHQVFRIIQLDRRGGTPKQPQHEIRWAQDAELILRGSNTNLNEQEPS